MTKEYHLKIRVDLQSLEVVRRFIEETAFQEHADPEAIHEVIHAVDEAMTNTYIHGYHRQPGPLEVSVTRKGDALVVTLKDQAPLFDPRLAPEPDLNAPLEERPVGGLGVYLIKEFIDEIKHQENEKGGNDLILVKKNVFRSKESIDDHQH